MTEYESQRARLVDQRSVTDFAQYAQLAYRSIPSREWRYDTHFGEFRWWTGVRGDCNLYVTPCSERLAGLTDIRSLAHSRVKVTVLASACTAFFRKASILVRRGRNVLVAGTVCHGDPIDSRVKTMEPGQYSAHLIHLAD